jgi:drug/metabolite transporter (DMT)-like permease
MVIVPANVKPCNIGYTGGALLLAVGVSAAMGQLFMTEGYRHLSVAGASLLCMLLPVFNFILGVTVFREEVSWVSVIGSVIVLTACACVILPEKRPFVPTSHSE